MPRAPRPDATPVPTTVATRSPSSRRPRRNCRRPGTDRTARSQPQGRVPRRGQPGELAQQRRDEQLEAELAAHRVAGEADDRARRGRSPRACGPPGCIASTSTWAPSGSSSSRTTSCSPIEMPPLVSSSSAPSPMASIERGGEGRRARRARGPARRVRLRPRARPPRARSPLASGICPGPSGSPGATSSLPVLITATRTRCARPPWRARPRPARRGAARRAACPAGSSGVAGARSLPASRTYSPAPRART